MVFDAFREVAVVVLKAFAVDGEVGFKGSVVVVYGEGEELFVAVVEGGVVEVFVGYLAEGGLFLVGGKREDGCDFKWGGGVGL